MRNCDKCGTELEPVIVGRVRRSNDFPAYRGALVITLTGGYGMFTDGGIDQFVICSSCALQLFALNEWLITPEIEPIVKGEVNEE